MRIVHLACIAPPQIGGIGHVASTEVAALQARGIEADLYAPGSVPSLWRIGNAARLDVRSVADKLTSADIVHLHYPFFGTSGIVVRWRRQGKIKRLVMTLHMDATAPCFKGLLFRLHRRWLQPYQLKTADALIVSSTDYARHSSFVSYVDRCIELPFGVDEQKFSPSTTVRSLQVAARSQNNLQLLWVGGMDRAHAFKGVDILLRAVAALPMNVICSLVGDGDFRSHYEKLSRKLGIEGRVKFLGRVSENELPNIYRCADVFVFPSTSNAEAFGLAALEAQSSGVPVVASNLPGVRTVVVNDETGFLVPPRDPNALTVAIKKLLDDAELRRRMGEGARQRVLEQYTWTKHINRLIEIYQTICASRY